MRSSAAPELHLATLAEDSILLEPWARAFADLCGQPIELISVGPARVPSIRFPRVFEPIELIAGIGHLRHSPALLAHVRSLGFDYEEDGRVLTVPAPGSFNLLLSQQQPPAGFRIAYANGAQAGIPLGAWLLRYLEGVITVAIHAPELYASVSELPPHERDRVRWNVTSVAHDLSIHALNYHRIPHTAITDVAERIRTALPERYESWSLPGASAPLTLSYFYDNDLNRYCYGVWCRCQRAEDFETIFSANGNYQQLLAALSVRLDETAGGRGDVASGDFDDMGKIAETSFEILAP